MRPGERLLIHLNLLSPLHIESNKRSLRMSTSDSELIDILGITSIPGEDLPPRHAPKPLPKVLPVLGLSDIVVFPGMVTPLLVESGSSAKLVDDAVAGDRLLGVVLQKDAEIKEPGPNDLWTHGCIARVGKMLKLPDNSIRILIEGLQRFRIERFVARKPYLKAKVHYLAEVVDDTIETTALARNAQGWFQEIIELSPTLGDAVKVSALNTEDPARLSDLIAANLNISLEERQLLLEMPVVKERLNRLQPLLHRELEVVSLGSKIQKDVAMTMSKTQRDYFLREQIRAIRKELGEPEAGTADLQDLKRRVEEKSLPDDALETAQRELARLENIPAGAPEYTLTRNYLDWILDLPWRMSTTDVLDLDTASRILDAQHYGLKAVKERLLDFLAVIKLKNELKGPILCLVGPPGVGKTSLGRSVADSLGRKFIRISLGGIRDEAEIRGHRRTYVGALPGRILQSLKRTGSNNPVILLDEVDKIGQDFRGDPSSALLEVLDPHQNFAFTDNYLEIPFDLSRVLFLTTANWLDPIHPALRDRLEIIELGSYTEREKLQIARKHLFPRQLKEHGLKRKQVQLPEISLRKIVKEYTREAGVRQLDRQLGALARKAARHAATHPNGSPPVFKVGPDRLSDVLGAPPYLAEEKEQVTRPGIALGLAWTPVGGEVLFIEVSRMKGKGNLILTGSLGDVMKESAQIAMSYLKSQCEWLNAKPEDFDRHDVHIHFPSGATPKDGPSAGLAILSALASLFSGRKVRSDTAMTGEISLRGRILYVGGIKEKCLAATRYQLKRVILPEGNRKDWEECPSEVRKKLRVQFVNNITDALRNTLKHS